MILKNLIILRNSPSSYIYYNSDSRHSWLEEKQVVHLNNQGKEFLCLPFDITPGRAIIEVRVDINNQIFPMIFQKIAKVFSYPNI
jgi:hypothetical protein